MEFQLFKDFPYFCASKFCGIFKSKHTMSVTRLKRKARRNVSRAKARVAAIKLLKAQPVIKQIDVEAIKKSFQENK